MKQITLTKFPVSEIILTAGLDGSQWSAVVRYHAEDATGKQVYHSRAQFVLDGTFVIPVVSALATAVEKLETDPAFDEKLKEKPTEVKKADKLD